VKTVWRPGHPRLPIPRTPPRSEPCGSLTSALRTQDSVLCLGRKNPGYGSERTNCKHFITLGVFENKSKRIFSKHFFLFSMPDKDHCKSQFAVLRTETELYREGVIKWPMTGLGSRRIVLCPYAYDRPSYAHRDCILSEDDRNSAGRHDPQSDPGEANPDVAEPKIEWSAVNATMCPESPFSQSVDTLVSFAVSNLCRLSFSLRDLALYYCLEISIGFVCIKY